MTLTLPKTCALGGSQTGLVGTAGVTLLNPDGTTHTARATAGIYEIGGGCYGKNIVFSDDWIGSILWDSGGGSPVYATEEYIYYENNPKVDDIHNIVNNATYGNAQLVRATTPANTLDVAATGEAAADAIKVSGDSAAADNIEATYDGTGYTAAAQR